MTLDEKDLLILPCSGCNGTARFTTKGENPTFFHTLPYCGRFERCNDVNDLIEYMRECNAKADRQRAEVR